MSQHARGPFDVTLNPQPLAFEDDGVVRYAVGNYDYYLEKRSAEANAINPRADPGRKSTTVALSSAKPRKLKWKEERELQGMEAAILAAESLGPVAVRWQPVRADLSPTTVILAPVLSSTTSRATA